MVGLLWFLSGVSDDRERKEEEKENAIQLAILEYEEARDEYRDAIKDREACIRQVETRLNSITNWHDLYSDLRIVSPQSAELVNTLEQNFDSRLHNQPLSVEEHCKDFPMPEVPDIPFILIQEGLINP